MWYGYWDQFGHLAVLEDIADKDLRCFLQLLHLAGLIRDSMRISQLTWYTDRTPVRAESSFATAFVPINKQC